MKVLSRLWPLVTLCTFACSNKDRTPAAAFDSAAASAAAATPVAAAGARASSCEPDGGPNGCSGAPPQPLHDPAYAKDNATWIGGLDFPLEGHETERLAKKGTGSRPKIQVQAIRDAGAIKLDRLSDREVVIARFTLTKAGGRDTVYGISKKIAKDYRDLFYLAIRRLETPDDGSSTNPAIANWRVYGVTTDGKLDPISTGTFRKCQDPHQNRAKALGAAFIPCELDFPVSKIANRPDVQAALQGAPLLAALAEVGDEKLATVSPLAQRLRTLLTIDELGTARTLRQRMIDAPAWMVCGAGCCTAEF